jgi:hypothetical protein
MRRLKILSFLLVLATGTNAFPFQDSTNQPDGSGINIIENRWSKHTAINKLDDDPLRAAQEQAALEVAIKNTLQENRARAAANQEPLRLPTRATASSRLPATPWEGYRYEVKVENTGKKAITKIEWMYILTERDSGRQVGEHRFRNETNIGPGKTKSLEGLSRLPATTVVDASKPIKDEPGQHVERVVITRVEYKDGSTWENPTN